MQSATIIWPRKKTNLTMAILKYYIRTNPAVENFLHLKCVFGLVTRKQVGCFVEVLNPQPLLAAFLLMPCLKSLFELRAAKLFR